MHNLIAGGIKNASFTVSGLNSFKYLRFEGGVHQVQRVPKTEKGGRMHTSTASVAVYPRPSEVESLNNYLSSFVALIILLILPSFSVGGRRYR